MTPSTSYQSWLTLHRSAKVGTEEVDPTTGDVKLYTSNNTLTSFTSSPIHLLDVEGDSGGNLVPMELRNQLELYDDAYFELRRLSVQEHLPRLVYAITD